MTNVNTPARDGFAHKAAGPLSMISILAISVGIAAMPAQAQEMTTTEPNASSTPVQAAPVILTEPAPMAPPTMTNPVPPAEPATLSDPAPTDSESRADDLARRGGFDAATAAPEALAQIEREQQARKEVAAAEAAASAAAIPASTVRSTRVRARRSTVNANQIESVSGSEGSAALAAGINDSVATPVIQPVPEPASTSEAMPADGGTDWSLLAALAAVLGIGSAGAFAATRRRKSKTRQAAALNAAIMPELRRKPARTAESPVAESAAALAEPTEEKRQNAKIGLAEFVATLPAFEGSPTKADRTVKLGQRRVAAAPRPYLDQVDLTRPAGYFTAHVDAMPTPQNPFLTRQKRVKRARFLDRKLAERSAPTAESRTSIVGKMKVSRPMEPAFA